MVPLRQKRKGTGQHFKYKAEGVDKVSICRRRYGHSETVRGHFRRGLTACVTIALLLVSICLPLLDTEAADSPDGRIIAIDYGNTGMSGDAVLVESKGQYILMDTGYAEKDRDIHDTKVIRYLKDHGIRDLDLYLSHYHNDHYYLMTTILQDPFFHVGTVYLPDVTDLLQYGGPGYAGKKWYDYFTKNLCLVKPSWEAHSYTEIMQVLEETGIPCVTLTKGSVFHVGDASFEVIWQRTDGSPSGNYRQAATGLINNSSLVTRVTIGGLRYLTAGDIEKPVEEDMLAAGVDLRADIVKTNHHSGDTSNIEAYYRAVRPTWIFGTGHDSARCRKRAHEVSANYANVKNNGTITFTIADGGITMEAERSVVTSDVEYKDAAGARHTKKMQFASGQEQFFLAKMLPAGARYCEYGWKTIAGKKYLFTDDGDPVYGLYTLKGKTYYFDPQTGILQTGWFRNADGGWLHAGSDGVLKSGWDRESMRIRISKRKYKTVTTTYYLDPETFVMATGFTEIGGKKYYFDPQSGAMATGTKTIDGQTYTFESTGEIRSGWHSVKKRVKIARRKYKTVTTWYYYLPENGQAARGYLEIEGKFYYFAQKDGAMQTGWITDGSDPADRRVYYGQPDGALVTGWQTIGGKEYYFYPDAHKQLEGRAVVEGGECVFGKDGVLLARVYGSLAEVPATVNGYVGVGDALYYVKAGVPQTGWQTIGGRRQYFDPADSGAMARGRSVIEGKAYWFDPADGILHTNGWVTSPEGGKYSADSSGVLRSGWYEQKVSRKVRKKYYLDPATNAAATGVTEIGGKRYFFDEKTGELKKNAWCRTAAGAWYRTDGSGVLKTDWYKESKRIRIRKRRYRTETTWYYLDRESGEMATGFREIDGKYYYFDKTSGAMATGAKTIDGVKYTFAAGGALQGDPPASVRPVLAMEPVTEATTETITETVTETAAETVTEAAAVTTAEAATVTTTEAAAVTTTQPAAERETEQAAESAAGPSTQGTTEAPAAQKSAEETPSEAATGE